MKFINIMTGKEMQIVAVNKWHGINNIIPVFQHSILPGVLWIGRE
jgi:hypothetical protein